MEIQDLKLRQKFNQWNMRNELDLEPGEMGFYGKPYIEQYPYYERFFDEHGIYMFVQAVKNQALGNMSFMSVVRSDEGYVTNSIILTTRDEAKKQNIVKATELWKYINSKIY